MFGLIRETCSQVPVNSTHLGLKTYKFGLSDCILAVKSIETGRFSWWKLNDSRDSPRISSPVAVHCRPSDPDWSGIWNDDEWWMVWLVWLVWFTFIHCLTCKWFVVLKVGITWALIVLTARISWNRLLLAALASLRDSQYLLEVPVDEVRRYGLAMVWGCLGQRTSKPCIVRKVCRAKLDAAVVFGVGFGSMKFNGHLDHPHFLARKLKQSTEAIGPRWPTSKRMRPSEVCWKSLTIPIAAALPHVSELCSWICFVTNLPGLISKRCWFRDVSRERIVRHRPQYIPRHSKSTSFKQKTHSFCC